MCSTQCPVSRIEGDVSAHDQVYPAEISFTYHTFPFTGCACECVKEFSRKVSVGTSKAQINTQPPMYTCAHSVLCAARDVYRHLQFSKADIESNGVIVALEIF